MRLAGPEGVRCSLRLLRLVGRSGTRVVLSVVIVDGRCGACCLHCLRVVRMRQGLMEGLSARMLGCSHSRLAVVHIGELRPIAGSGLLVLLL